jgi:hypothetical protein
MDEFESELLLKEQDPESPTFSFRRYRKQKNGNVVACLMILVVLLSGLNIWQWRVSRNESGNVDGYASRSHYGNFIFLSREYCSCLTLKPSELSER